MTRIRLKRSESIDLCDMKEEKEQFFLPFSLFYMYTNIVYSHVNIILYIYKQVKNCHMNILILNAISIIFLPLYARGKDKMQHVDGEAVYYGVAGLPGQ
jgi:hypothetical protein